MKSDPSRVVIFLKFIASFALASMFSMAAINETVAQDGIEKISIPLRISAGMRFQIQIAKERVDKRDGSVTSHFKSNSIYDGAFDGVTESGMSITWKLSDFNVDQIVVPTKKPPVELDQVAKDFDFPIQFEADAFGQPLKLVNRAQFEKVMRGLFQKMSGPNSAGALKIMEETFFALPDNQFAQMFLQEALLIGQGQSIEVPRADVVEGREDQPSPLGGPPILYVSKLRFVGETADDAQFELVGAFDQNSMRENAIALFEMMAKKAGKSVEEVRKGVGELKIVRRDLIIFTVSKKTGWTKHISFKKNISSSVGGKSKERSKSWEIDVLPE